MLRNALICAKPNEAGALLEICAGWTRGARGRGRRCVFRVRSPTLLESVGSVDTDTTSSVSGAAAKSASDSLHL